MASKAEAAQALFTPHVGQEEGVSDWHRVDQKQINLFADATGDHQFIHVDPERASQTPFGTTIAHGFLTLSLLPYLGGKVAPIADTILSKRSTSPASMETRLPTTADRSAVLRRYCSSTTPIRCARTCRFWNALCAKVQSSGSTACDRRNPNNVLSRLSAFTRS